MPRESLHDVGELPPGTMIDGRYRIVRPIGQGGNGMVYEVEHSRTGRKLALKALLDETGFARLEQEARAASLMKNGHTAKIIDMEAGGPTGAYMVMELLEGQSLRALLDDAGQLPLGLTVNMAMQVCECLHEAHALGIIHRDLKPENIFLCASPWPGQYDVKVLDFGVMKIADGGGAIPKSSLTRTGSTVGTPYYMSLEQLRNSSAVDARADVYSLGVVLYECLSGRKPFQADTIGDLVYALCSGPPTPLSRLRPDVSPETAETVMRTLSANRDDRPPSMLDLALALLPHASQAFALWVKVDGKQPALARSAATPGPAADPPPLAASPFAPGPAAPVPRIPPPRPSAPQRVLPTLNLAPGALPAPGDLGHAPPPKPVVDGGGRRDTPTEMYVNAVHGAPPEIDEERSGDRDTPTRAIQLDALGRAPALETLKSPLALPTDDDVPDVPTFDLRDGASLLPPVGQPLPPSARLAKTTMPLGMTPPVLPAQEIPAPTLQLRVGDAFGPGGATPMPASAEPGLMRSADPPASSPFKPAWQQSIDRALIRAGGWAETQGQRFRAAPQNTQIIVVIVAGTGLILLLGFALFLAVR